MRELICDLCHKAKDVLRQRINFPGVMRKGVYASPMICDDCIPFDQEDSNPEDVLPPEDEDT